MTPTAMNAICMTSFLPSFMSFFYLNRVSTWPSNLPVPTAGNQEFHNPGNQGCKDGARYDLPKRKPEHAESPASTKNRTEWCKNTRGNVYMRNHCTPLMAIEGVALTS